MIVIFPQGASFGQPGPYGQPSHTGGAMGSNPMGGGWNPGASRASMEMPNIQALGLSNTGQGQAGSQVHLLRTKTFFVLGNECYLDFALMQTWQRF